MKMKNLTEKAEVFIKNNSECDSFPKEISAPIIAKFCEMVLRAFDTLNEIYLKYQAEVFINEEELEEVSYCEEKFINAMVNFTKEQY